MKLRHLAFVLILLLLLPSAAAWPLIVIPETTIALDEPVLEGSVAKGEFQILNEGDQELVIEKVAPG